MVIASPAEPQRIGEVAGRLVQKAFGSGLFIFADADVKFDQPQVEVVFDRDKLRSQGVELSQAGADLSALLGGNYVNRFSIQGRSDKVIPQVKREERLTPDQLPQMYITGSDDRLVPLSTFASLRTTTEPRELKKFQQLNAVRVQGVIPPPVSLDQALSVLENEARASLPEGFTIDYAGQSRQLRTEGGRFLGNRVRVEAGQIPPLDLVQAEAEVAQRRENLVRARTIADDAEDGLRRPIVDPADASFWRVRLDPVEEPTVVGALPDIDAAVASALDRRYDIARAGQDLENARTTVAFLDNQRLPDVRLETSYRGNGLGGTQFLRGGGFPGPITGTRSRGLGDALGQVFTSDYPTWSFGLTASYPLGRSYEAANYARADVERRQAAQRIASLRVQAAETVRRAGRQVHSTAERVQAARATATLARERLVSEQRRFEVGLSTTFLVTQAQRDLLEAEVNLLQTTLEYESALVSFEAVQEAPPPGPSDASVASGSSRAGGIVLLPPATPRGLFRPGTGGAF